MKSVLVLTSTFPRWKNDTTPSFVYDLSNHLGKKYSITVLAPHASNSLVHEKIGDIEVHRFRYFSEKHQKIAYGAGILLNVKKSMLAKLQIPLFLLSELKMASELAAKKKIDIVHAHWMIPQGIIGVHLKKKYGIPLIVTIHGSDLFPLKSKLFIHLQEKTLRNADAITVNSFAARSEIISRFPHLSEKIRLIPMGVDTRLFSRKPASKLRKKYRKSRIILFAGRLNEQKGVEYLIKSMPGVKKAVPNAKLLIIGDGEHAKHLEKLCSILSLNDVEFLGPKKQKELAEYYSICDAFVLPAVTSKIGTESFGLVIVEAMACGACVIGSESGGIKDIIQDRHNGLLAKERNSEDIADKIIRILSDKKLRKKLQKNAIKSSKKYSWKNISSKFNDIYRSLQ